MSETLRLIRAYMGFDCLIGPHMVRAMGKSSRGTKGGRTRFAVFAETPRLTLPVDRAERLFLKRSFGGKADGLDLVAQTPALKTRAKKVGGRYRASQAKYSPITFFKKWIYTKICPSGKP
jgi:hypothetical protein